MISRRTLAAAALGAGLAPLAGRFAFAQTAAQVQIKDPAGAALIDAGATVEMIAEGFTWSEGPCWVGGPDGFLVFSDVPGNRMHRWSPKAGLSVFMEPSGYAGPASPMFREAGSNGIITARGGLVVADSGNRCLAAVDLKTRRKRVLVSAFQGKRLNSPNDLVLAADGAIYFTDPPYGLKGVDASPNKELDFWGLYRLDRSGRLDLIDRTLRVNGVGLSPDGRTLYTTDPSGWYAFDLDAKGLPVGRRLFVDSKTTGGRGGDGLKVDEHGNVWASTGNSLQVFAPDGRPLAAVVTDAALSNCAFGADGHVYFSNNHRVGRVRVKVKGAHTRLPRSAGLA